MTLYIYIYIYVLVGAHAAASQLQRKSNQWQEAYIYTCFSWARASPNPNLASLLSLYKRLFYFAAFMWKTIILLLTLPPELPALLRYYCMSIAQDTTPPRPPPPLYALHYTILVMAISCKGQVCAGCVLWLRAKRRRLVGRSPRCRGHHT